MALTNRRVWFVAAVLAVACSVALLLAVSGEKAQAAFPGKNGRIAFSFLRREPGGSSWQIFTINPDGTGEKQLTHSSDPFHNHSPSYSPDGRKIAWERNGDIWVMNADGTGQERLTSGLVADRTPAFSPSGRKVAFVRNDLEEGQADIYIKTLGGAGGPRQVTNDDAYERGPVFRPDGGRIAFARAKPHPGCADCIAIKSELATVRPDGTGFKVLTHTPSAQPDNPDWSPDGRKLVFDLTAGLAGPVRIQTIKADGTKRRTVAATIKGGRFLLDPVFSPDGKKVAFERVPDKGEPDIWVMGADGTNPTDVSPIPKRSRGRFEIEPDWGSRPTTAK